jgi:cytochrome c-type biogenesis protein CcmH/NrfF
LQGEHALTPAAPPPDWKTWLLWAVLVGAAALIGGLALSLLRGPKT